MAAKHLLIPHSELKRLVHYDPQTGVFTAKAGRPNVPVGKVLGSVNGKGYLDIPLNGKLYRANRLAWYYMTGEWPGDMQVDHVDGDKLNDRFDNLRICTNTENGRNTNLSKRNTSGVKGVMWYRQTQKWTASIRVNRKLIHLGYFDNFDDAVAARHAAELEHFGAFSPLVCRSE